MWSSLIWSWEDRLFYFCSFIYDVKGVLMLLLVEIVAAVDVVWCSFDDAWGISTKAVLADDVVIIVVAADDDEAVGVTVSTVKSVVVVVSSYTGCCYVRSWGESMEKSSLYRAGNTTFGCCCLNLLNDSMCIMEMSLLSLDKNKFIFSGLKTCKRKFTHRKLGILLSRVSSTVTSPFSGAWLASSSCLIAFILKLKSLWISVLPRTPLRSIKKKCSFTLKNTGSYLRFAKWLNYLLLFLLHTWPQQDQTLIQSQFSFSQFKFSYRFSCLENTWHQSHFFRIGCVKCFLRQHNITIQHRILREIQQTWHPYNRQLKWTSLQ